MLLAVAAPLSACTNRHPPVIAAERGPTGDQVSYAGVAVTVPRTWRVVNHAPAECFSIRGRTAYFYVQVDDPYPLGCPSDGANGAYISVECGATAPTGVPDRNVGPFDADVTAQPAGRYHARAHTYIYLVGRSTQIDIEARASLLSRIESSIRSVSGSC